MKPSKNKLQGLVVLAILFVVYTVIVFVVPFRKAAVFVLSYLFTVVAFAVQVYVFRLSFRQGDSVRSKFYGIPIARIGVIYLIAQVVVSLVFMALGAVMPVWLAVVILIVLLAAAALGVIAADAMRDEIERQDVQLRKDVTAMRTMQSKAVFIAGQCGDADTKQALEKLAEALRFSDPVSSSALADAETGLAACIDELQAAVIDGDYASARTLCARAEAALAERNRLCKLTK